MAHANAAILSLLETEKANQPNLRLILTIS